MRQNRVFGVKGATQFHKQSCAQIYQYSLLTTRSCPTFTPYALFHVPKKQQKSTGAKAAPVDKIDFRFQRTFFNATILLEKTFVIQNFQIEANLTKIFAFTSSSKAVILNRGTMVSFPQKGEMKHFSNYLTEVKMLICKHQIYLCTKRKK